jgi:hypothetical protein
MRCGPVIIGSTAVLILAEPHEQECLRLVSLIRRQKLPVKVIIKTVGCNQDELETQFC